MPPGSHRRMTCSTGTIFATSMIGGVGTHALRLRMGDEAFFAMLQVYAARYQYGNVTIEDFIAVAEEFSGEDLTSFSTVALCR